MLEGIKAVMPEKPLLSILDREEAKKLAAEHFGDRIKLLRELANYGSNLVLRAYNSSEKGYPDFVVCGVLLKQVVAMLDAVETLVEAGIVHAAFLPVRAAFEAWIYLSWILLSDSDRKARCYLVSNLRDERLWALRTIKGTPEEAAFDALTKRLGEDYQRHRPTASEAQEHLAEVNRILAQSDFREIDREFDRRKKKLRREPKWYQLVGANSIRQVAKDVDRLLEYDFFYSEGSQVAHSASYRDHIRLGKGQVHFKPIRNLEGIYHLINFAFICAWYSFREILQRYRPGELPAFSRKYVKEWRTAFRSIKSVRYNYLP